MLLVDELLGHFHLLLRQWFQINPLLGHGGTSRVQAHGLLEDVKMRVCLNIGIVPLMASCPLHIDMFCTESLQSWLCLRSLTFVFLFGLLSHSIITTVKVVRVGWLFVKVIRIGWLFVIVGLVVTVAATAIIPAVSIEHTRELLSALSLSILVIHHVSGFGLLIRVCQSVTRKYLRTLDCC